MINNALQLSITLTNRIAGHTADIAAHEAVLTAIEKGDAFEARRASEAILRDSLNLIETAQV